MDAKKLNNTKYKSAQNCELIDINVESEKWEVILEKEGMPPNLSSCIMSINFGVNLPPKKRVNKPGSPFWPKKRSYAQRLELWELINEHCGTVLYHHQYVSNIANQIGFLDERHRFILERYGEGHSLEKIEELLKESPYKPIKKSRIGEILSETLASFGLRNLHAKNKRKKMRPKGKNRPIVRRNRKTGQ